ncbi:MAG TPA: HD-GYP domain-containing protein, partial [Chloroflexota bacterium]|nr:HD-GYP domain-containing protein [Chloroflexota bacterium]
ENAMRKLIVDQLEPGMVLARSIDNERGDSLLAKGVSLTQQYSRAYRTKGRTSVDRPLGE